MSAFTFEQQNELKNLFTRWADESTGARLTRQLQGTAASLQSQTDALQSGTVTVGSNNIPITVGRNKYTFTIPFAATVLVGSTSNAIASTVTVHGMVPTSAPPATSWTVDIETNAAQTVVFRWIAN